MITTGERRTVTAIMWVGLGSVIGRTVDYLTLTNGQPTRLHDTFSAPGAWAVVWLVTAVLLMVGLILDKPHVLATGCFAAALAYGATTYVQVVDVVRLPHVFELRWAVESGMRALLWLVLLAAALHRVDVVRLAVWRSNE